MDKNAIKKYAVWARNELIARVSQKAQKYGFSKDEIVPGNADSVNGILLTDTEKKQRRAMLKEINQKGLEQAIEEISYAWFNRFAALRFMEANAYLPSHVRVFTDVENNFKPQILTEAIHLNIDGLDMGKVYELKEDNKTEELFRYLLITQCNALSKILPGMFQKISDYTELMLPDNLLREGSVIEQMITLIPEEDWTDQVQIIGWLYQYYNTEPKDQVFADLKKNIKISKEKIPAATQLFTPDWIVHYMVENSLGRLWIEGHPNSAASLLPTEEGQAAYAAGERSPGDTRWHYYLEEAEQEPEVEAQLEEIRKEYAALKPEEILCIDPCMGSGHILCVLFDTLVQIYTDYGYTAREATKSIIENNLWGLDIDDRAAQLAYFAVMMKARQYDRRFLSRKDENGEPDIPQPHVYAIAESNHVSKEVVEYFCNGDEKLESAMQTIIAELNDAKEYGSILITTPQDWTALYARFDEIRDEISMFKEAALALEPLVQTAQALEQKYSVTVTNPPYRGIGDVGEKLQAYVKKNYPDSKSDLSTCFMERCSTFTEKNKFISMINIPVWMFISSYSDLRKKLLNGATFINMLHFGRGVFGSDFGTTSFVLLRLDMPEYKSVFRKLHTQVGNVDSLEQKKAWFFDGYGYYTSQKIRFFQIPTNPIAYWLSKKASDLFEEVPSLREVADPRQGLATGNDERYLRLWQEVDVNQIGFGCKNIEEFRNVNYFYAPFNKGGAFRKWYGNNNRVIRFDEKCYEELLGSGNHLPSRQLYFREGITWSALTAGDFSGRYCGPGFVFAGKGPMCFPNNSDDVFYLLGFLNSKLTGFYMKVFSSTTDFNQGPMRDLPLIMDSSADREIIENLVKNNIQISKNDWDSFETSWDFQHHPLLADFHEIRYAWQNFKQKCEANFEILKSNEEKLNRIFIKLYGLENDISFEVADKDVTIHRIFDEKINIPDSMEGTNYALTKEDVVKSLISYAVGCMFGRYSLDYEGLAYAGGEWDLSKYKTFPADKDAIIPICDDEYFMDDIVGLFVKFIETVYGVETLEENLRFIADALGGRGTSREVIRNYFLNDFFKDHCRTYQKRPIYWLFDSGKKNGFKCLIYMHRYQPDTIARIRTDYVHEQQSRYRTAIKDLEQRIAGTSTSERVKLNKQLQKLQGQDTEIRLYEEKIHHLADQFISIDLDDGVKVNYAKFQDVLAKIK